MFFGANLQYLRHRRGLTQEQLAQHMGVSRQTISKWEAGQPPELGKLLELADLFHCKLDDLLRLDLSVTESPVRLLRLKGFSMAQYVMISPHAEEDIRSYLTSWSERNGLKDRPYLSWSFPYVSPEQKNRFHLTGFAAACVLPEDFVPLVDGPELIRQPDCDYAVITLPEPVGRESRHIARGIQAILEYLREAGIPKTARDGFLPCFERRYEKDGIHWVDIFVQCQSSQPTDSFSF